MVSVLVESVFFDPFAGNGEGFFCNESSGMFSK